MCYKEERTRNCASMDLECLVSRRNGKHNGSPAGNGRALSPSPFLSLPVTASLPPHVPRIDLTVPAQKVLHNDSFLLSFLYI